MRTSPVVESQKFASETIDARITGGLNLRMYEPPASYPRSCRRMQPLHIVWSRVWAHRHSSALKGGYAPILFTISDTHFRVGVLDLADFAHAAQTHVFADLEPPED